MKCLTCRFRRALTAAIFLWVFAAAVRPARAEEPSFTLEVDAETIGLRDSLDVTLTLSGAEAAMPDRIEVAGFQVAGRPSQRSSWSFVNGQVTSSVSQTFRLVPTKIGDFTVGPFEITVKGRQVRSNSARVQVVEGSRTNGQAGSVPDDFWRGPVASRRRPAAQGKIFVLAEVDKNDVYVGEQVFLRVRLFTQLPVENLSQGEQPDLKGFWIEDVPISRNLSPVRVEWENERYTAYEIKKAALFPTRAGDLEIGPMAWTLGVAESDFFFSNVRPVTRSTQAEVIRVKPLPDKGKPAGFRGAVGRFWMQASVSPDTVKVNSAVTLTVKVSGEGNLRTMGEPAVPALGDFKSYSSRTSDNVAVKDGAVAGTKTWEYVLVPRAPGEQSIPPIELSFFDPAKGEYRTETTSALRIVVEKDGSDGYVSTGPSRVEQQEIRTVGDDIRYIRLDPGRPQPARVMPFGRFPFFLLMAAPVLGCAGLFVHIKRMERSRADLPMSRFRKAYSTARRKLSQAGRHLDARKPGDFYSLISDALTGFVGDKFNVAQAGLTHPEIGRMLTSAGIPSTDAGKFLDILETCDRGRFAPVSSDLHSMKRLLRLAVGRIRSLDRRLVPARIRSGEAARP